MFFLKKNALPKYVYGGKEVEWIQLPPVEGYCKHCNENRSYTNGGKISIPFDKLLALQELSRTEKLLQNNGIQITHQILKYSK